MLTILFLVLFLFQSCNFSEKERSDPKVVLIPKPQQMEQFQGALVLEKNILVFVPTEFELAGDFLKTYIQNGSAINVKNTSVEQADIIFRKVDAMAPEGYSLEINNKGVIISAPDAAGAFYGVQTVRQLLSPHFERTKGYASDGVELPYLMINDAPAFPYRGMHLDVSRHFFPKEFIKKYIASLALLKMNYFHWHLTDDQGWRIEIKSYPELTTKAAFREETLIGHYNDSPQKFDGKRYGGFYTQEDIKEIVAFAQKHNVTIIPEIEMPGHAQAAISAYPELGCAGKNVNPATKWGVFENIFCPNQKTFAFLEDVLTEVMELFPGEYVHIGGDEAPKTQWKKCARCQNLIAEHQLKDESELQSWFIGNIEKFVNSKGKKIIGWDEILEGGLAPNAVVMSWRGESGGIEAAKHGNAVIMTPNSHLYFDYYQAENDDEPLAIGGFIPLKKVYEYDPVPEELTAVEAHNILGAQGNVWTEYLKTSENVEYMAFPRMLALSEVVWSGPAKNDSVGYANFVSRLEDFYPRLDALDIHYANHLYELDGKVLKKGKEVFFELKTPTAGKQIRYAINNSEEIEYNSPFQITEDVTIKARLYEGETQLGETYHKQINFHKGITGNIAINVEPHPAYSSGGKTAIINGVSGSDTRYGDTEWLGFWGDDLEITINLTNPSEVRHLSTRFYNATGQWIYAPRKVEIVGTLKGGTEIKQIISVEINDNSRFAEVEADLSEFELKDLQHIRLIVPSYGIIPDGMQGAGNKAWTFIDEIYIE